MRLRKINYQIDEHGHKIIPVSIELWGKINTDLNKYVELSSFENLCELLNGRWTDDVEKRAFDFEHKEFTLTIERDKNGNVFLLNSADFYQNDDPTGNVLYEEYLGIVYFEIQ